MPAAVILIVMVAASLTVAVFVSWPLLVAKDESEPEGADEEDSALDHLLVQKENTYSALKELEFDHAMGNLSREDYSELARRYEDRAVALLQTIDDVAREENPWPAGAPAVAGVMLGTAHASALEEQMERQGAGRRHPTPGLRLQATVDEVVERQVAALRGAPGRSGRSAKSSADEIERQVAALRRRQRPAAGRDRKLEAGVEQQVAALRASRAHPARHETVTGPTPEAGATCSSCGAPVKNPQAAFCRRCGVSLASSCPVCGGAVDREDSFCSACGASLSRTSQSQVEDAEIGGANA